MMTCIVIIGVYQCSGLCGGACRGGSGLRCVLEWMWPLAVVGSSLQLRPEQLNYLNDVTKLENK